MLAEGFDSTIFNETDTNDELMFLNTSFDSDLDGDLHFLRVNLKKLYLSRKVALFSHNVFSTILTQRHQRYKEYGRCVSLPDEQEIILTKFPPEISQHLNSHFFDMERLLKEKKINGVSMIFYNNENRKIVESYKFMIYSSSGEIKAFTDYNGRPIVDVPTEDVFTSDKRLFIDIYGKIYNHCKSLPPIENNNIYPLFRFHFIKRVDRKEYEKFLQSQPLFIRFRQKPSFGTDSNGVLIVANERKRFRYGFVYNHI
uniref:Cilia- and flagella-associated protein 299 n=1 Tax=Strongyloides stercoralis TaxID=6248 RepID=A0A0K0ET05_STRER